MEIKPLRACRVAVFQPVFIFVLRSLILFHFVLVFIFILFSKNKNKMKNKTNVKSEKFEKQLLDVFYVFDFLVFPCLTSSSSSLLLQFFSTSLSRSSVAAVSSSFSSLSYFVFDFVLFSILLH